jgi:eukaryotic-like serine/threonine-protein kinase
MAESGSRAVTPAASSSAVEITDIPGIEVLGTLGRGANAAVYRVRHGDAEYALKVLEGVTGPAELTAFRREAALLAGAVHSGLIRIHEVGLTAGRPYLVMDLVAGRPLAEELGAGTLPEDRAIRLAADLAGALAAVHAAGLVHRDIKPRNVLIAPDGAARLVDFGLIGRAGAGDGQLAVGTLAYAAPEQAGTLNRPLDARSDLYSLGVLLYECVTGRLPFESADLGALLRMHAVLPPPDPRELARVSAGFTAMLNALLAKDPDDRYASAEALLADLPLLATSGFVPDTRARHSARPAGRLSGRAVELRALTAEWNRAAAGEGGIAVVRGAAGSGKSRLVGELAACVPAWVMRGTCAADDPVPLSPIRTALANLIDSLPADGKRVVQGAAEPAAVLLAGLSPALDALLDHQPPASGAGVDPGQHAIAIAAFLRELARACGGLLFALDDVQWLDEGSRRVLGELTADLAGTPLLVLATARDDEPVADLGAAVRLDLPLHPLTAEGIAELLADQLPGARTSTELAQLIATRSGGNPFTALAYLRAIVDAGLLRPYWGQWLLDEAGLAALDLPGHTLGLVLARLADLGPDARGPLTVAAVAGARFDPAVVAAACPSIEPHEVRAALAEAVSRRLVEIRADGTHAFVHDRIRAALLSGVDAAPIHQRIAEVLDAGVGGPGQEYARAGHHLRGLPGATPDAALGACVAAGELALAAHAANEAVGFLEHAAGLEIPLGVDFHLLYGTALQRAGQYTRALDQLGAALAGSTEPFARAAILARIAEVHRSRWAVGEAMRAVHSGLGELGLAPPRGALAFVLSVLSRWLLGALVGRTRLGFGRVGGDRRERYRLASWLHRTGGYALAAGMDSRALLYHLRVLFWVNRLGPSVEYTLGICALGSADILLGRDRAARRAFRRAEAAATEIDDPLAGAHVAYTQAIGQVYASQDGAGERLGRVVQERRSWLDTGLYCDAVSTLAWLAVTEGRTAEAVEWAERGRRRLALVGEPDLNSLITSRMNYLAATGLAAEAATELRRVRELTGDAGDTGALALLVDGAELWALCELGELGAPLDRALDRAAELNPRRANRTSQPAFACFALARLAQCRAGLVPVETAASAVRRLRVAAGKNPVTRAFSAVARADLAVLQGEPRQAVDLLRELGVLRPDAPLVAYEACRVRARAYAALGDEGEAHRQARTAAVIAADQRWPHRVRWVAAEFGVDESVGSGHGGRSVASGPSPARLERLSAVEEVSRLAAHTLDPDELIRITLDAVARILSAERALLFLADPADPDGPLVPHSGRDAAGSDIAEPTGYSASLVDRVRADRQVLVVTGTEEGAAPGAESAVIHGLRSIMVAPLLRDSRLLGVVYLDSQPAKGIFTPEDAGVLTALTNHVAISLETLRAAQLEVSVRAARRQRDVAEALRSALATMAGTLEPDAVLTVLVRAAAELLPGERAFVLLRKESGEYVLRSVDGDQPLPADPDLAALVDTDAPVLGADAGPAVLAPVVNRSWAGVPMVARDTRLGALLLSSTEPDRYQEPELALAAALVAQAMIAWDNARLFAQVRRLAGTD